MNNSVGKAAKWSSLTEIMAKLIMPISSMILARVLAPEVFGIVASINMVISFCDLFADAGFQKYIVQHEMGEEESLEETSSVAFWTNMVVSLIIWLVVAIFAEPISNLVGCPGKSTAVIVACANLPLHSFVSIQSAILKRDLNFKPLFFTRIATIVTPIFVTVPLAIFTRSYWAMVIGTIVGNIWVAIIMAYLLRWKPLLWFDFEILKRMFKFSVWSMLESVLVWTINWGDVFVVSGVLTTYYLGLYKTSMNIVNQIIGIVSASIVPVLLSALSRQQNNNDTFQKTYYRFCKLSGALLLPMGVGMWVYRDTMCMVALGGAWLEAATLMGAWGLISAVAVIFNSYNGAVLIAKGKPHISVYIQLIQIVCIVPTVYFSAKIGFMQLSYSRALVRIVGMAAHSVVVWKIAGISFKNVIRDLLPAITGSAVVGLAGTVFISASKGLLFNVVSILLCVVIYFAVILLFPEVRNVTFPVIRKILHKGIDKNQVQNQENNG